MLFIQWLVFGETKQLSLKNKYRIYLGVGFADTLDPNDRCHCSKWFTRYEPTTGCLNGTRWAIRDCDSSFHQDSSCFYNTMWREECPRNRVPMERIWVWSTWSECSKDGESTRRMILDSSLAMREETKKCQFREYGAKFTDFYEDFEDFDMTVEFNEMLTWSEWGDWSICQAGLPYSLNMRKSDIKSSDKCVAGSMSRIRYCEDDLPICKSIDTNYDIETRLCHVPQCEWGDWEGCRLSDNKMTRRKDCGSLCNSVCDPKISICSDIESLKCTWKRDDLALKLSQENTAYLG